MHFPQQQIPGHFHQDLPSIIRVGDEGELQEQRWDGTVEILEHDLNDLIGLEQQSYGRIYWSNESITVQSANKRYNLAIDQRNIVCSSLSWRYGHYYVRRQYDSRYPTQRARFEHYTIRWIERKSRTLDHDRSTCFSHRTGQRRYCVSAVIISDGRIFRSGHRGNQTPYASYFLRSVCTALSHIVVDWQKRQTEAFV